jgi:parallel beta-helix repeat protein
VLPFWVPLAKPPQSEFSPGVHYVPETGALPAIVVKSSDTTIDLTDFELTGSRLSEQERYAGIGILFDHCRNLVVKNGKVHGYRINVLLRGCENVHIEGLRADYSHADLIRNSNGLPIDKFLNVRNVETWTTYGAGIWLHNCSKCHLVRCSAHHAMNGAVLVTSNNCFVYDCDFSYNSAWGLALWDSSQNHLTWNHLDFCNRPWSGGWGGDAADLLLVSNSNYNVVVGNSLTHGGDGFFLTDRVEGGWSEQQQKFNPQDNCNFNVVWSNDGSWASANSFESTFSHDNLFGENVASESGYGFWLGYSSYSLIAANHVDHNEHDGVAIEHGHANRILSNILDSDQEAGVRLWSTPGPKDTAQPSSDNMVAYNVIENCGTTLDLKGSTNTAIFPKDPNGNPSADSQSAPDPQTTWVVPNAVAPALDGKPANWKSYRDSGGPVGQAWIQPGNYAPIPFLKFGSAFVNWTNYKLWFARPPVNISGPSWVSFESGQDPRYVTAVSTVADDDGSERSALIRFSLPGVGDQPDNADAVKQSQMTLRFRTGAWDCKWFRWKDLAYDDRKSWLYLFNSAPVAEEKLPALNADYSQQSPVPNVLQLDHFALLATRRFTFTSGIYRFSTVSDDGIRLFVDGREVISHWDHHPATSDTIEIPLSAGPHDMRVEYLHEDGAAQIRVDWKKVRSSAPAAETGWIRRKRQPTESA